jgi:hypothetical protein
MRRIWTVIFSVCFAGLFFGQETSPARISFATGDARYVNVPGDTMTGALTLDFTNSSLALSSGALDGFCGYDSTGAGTFGLFYSARALATPYFAYTSGTGWFGTGESWTLVGTGAGTQLRWTDTAAGPVSRELLGLYLNRSKTVVAAGDQAQVNFYYNDDAGITQTIGYVNVVVDNPDDLNFKTHLSLKPFAGNALDVHATTADFGARRLEDLLAPDSSDDAATKGYVDTAADSTRFAHAARAYLNAAVQPIATGVPEKIAFDGETFDTGADFDSTTNFRFQPDKAGIYSISSSVLWSPSALGVRGISIYLNGSEYSFVEITPSGLAEVSTIIHDLIDLNGTTDYVEIWVTQDTGGDLDVVNGSSYTWFTATYAAD